MSNEFGRGVISYKVGIQLTLLSRNCAVHQHVVHHNSISCQKKTKFVGTHDLTFFLNKLLLKCWLAHRWSLNLVYHHHPPTTGTLCVVVVRPSVQRRHLEHFPVFNQIIHNIVIAPRFKARRLEDVSNPCRVHMYSIVNNSQGWN